MTWGCSQDVLREGVQDPFIRQSIVVALGWLGVPLSVDEAVRDTASHDETSAWILSVVLFDSINAEASIEHALPSLSGAAERTAETALMRLRLGHIFSVIG